MSDKVIYTIGGTVQAGGGIYIHRDADEELLRLCREGEFCYVLTARQMGKSSLMVATMERLAAEGIRSVEIDLTQIGTELSGLTAEQWYLGLIDLIVEQLDLDVDYMAWWDERAHLGPTQRLSQFLRQVVLERVSEPVVIFIDEIDSTLNLDFTDDFFAAIRACYNARASDLVFKRLSFVLLGVATPGDLISDPQRTPFNIGRRIDLTDFAERQAIPLAAGLDLPPREADRALTWILDWTGGHPYLTQRLCAAAAASPTKSWDAAAVDKLVEETFFGEQSARDSNLQFVRDMLTQRAPDKDAVLKTYRRIHAGKAVSDEERSPAKTHLKLSGIVKAEDGYLQVRNEIYRRIFNLAWVRENTQRDWALIAAGIAIGVALVAVGSILYNFWVGIQFQDCYASFYQTSAPEEQVTHLARIFRLRGLFGPTDYDYQARQLFYGLSREEQLALFGVYKVEASDLTVVIKGLYITLADTDGTDSTRPLLEAMVHALDYLNETEETNDLRNEINNWLEGRKLAKQNQDSDALAEYNKAIALNGENPATLYERARVLTELSEYQQALGDLDQVIAIAGRAPAPTPTTSPSTTVSITLPMLSPTSTLTPGTDMTPTETPSSASVTATSASSPISTETPIPIATPAPAAITSEFATTGQMISAVRNVIYGNPDLVSSLASAPDSEYPNLREFGLVPTLTPTASSIASPTPTKATSTPTPTPARPTPTPAPPDLVMTVLEIIGQATMNSEGGVEVPIRVVVKNQGDAEADIFKVSTEYTGPNGTFLIPFTVPGQDDIWYPYASAPLGMGSDVTFAGNVTFRSALQGQTISLKAMADSCAGEEFTPDFCRVEESNEDNNESTPIPVSLPSLRPPEVTITNPDTDSGTSDNEYAYDGFDEALGLWYKDVVLQGSATDPEGILSLAWTTDRKDIQDPFLGTGTNVTIRLYSNECTGVWHEITLTGTDSKGNASRAVRRIFIWTLC